MVAASSDELVSAYERRITWDLPASGVTDKIDSSYSNGDASGWETAWVLTNQTGAVEVYIEHEEATGTPNIEVKVGTGGANNALLNRNATSTSVGLIQPFCPDMLLQNTHTGNATVTLVLKRSATLDVLHQQNQKPQT